MEFTIEFYCPRTLVVCKRIVRTLSYEECVERNNRFNATHELQARISRITIK